MTNTPLFSLELGKLTFFFNSLLIEYFQVFKSSSIWKGSADQANAISQTIHVTLSVLMHSFVCSEELLCGPPPFLFYFPEEISRRCTG